MTCRALISEAMEQNMTYFDLMDQLLIKLLKNVHKGHFEEQWH